MNNEVFEKVEELEETVIETSDINDFINFLSENESYLDSGYGAFHTDNHSNW